MQAIVRGQRRLRPGALTRPEFHTVPAAEGNWARLLSGASLAEMGSIRWHTDIVRGRTSVDQDKLAVTATAGQKQPASPSPSRRSNDPRTSGLRAEQFPAMLFAKLDTCFELAILGGACRARTRDQRITSSQFSIALGDALKFLRRNVIGSISSLVTAERCRTVPRHSR